MLKSLGRKGSSSSHALGLPSSKSTSSLRTNKSHAESSSSAFHDFGALPPLPTAGTGGAGSGARKKGSSYPGPADAALLDAAAAGQQPAPEYGYLGFETGLVLGVEEVNGIVQQVGGEICRRGLTAPLLFSSLALDLSPPSSIHSLLSLLLRARISPSTSPARREWETEIAFACVHDLAAVVRWALARIVRVSSPSPFPDEVAAGIDSSAGGLPEKERGFVDLAVYERWRETERGANYPPNAYTALLRLLPPVTASLLDNTLHILSRTAAHASTNGGTPTRLAHLFGPLLFGLGPPNAPFEHAYDAFVVGANATEHVLLSYIRAEDERERMKGAAGVAVRLQDWIKGYPSMLSPSLSRPPPSARLIYVSHIQRTTRLYSPDLVRSSPTWDVPPSREWDRLLRPLPPGTPPSSLLARSPEYLPAFSDEYRRRLAIPQHHVAAERKGGSKGAAAGEGAEVARWRSLVDMQWNMFLEGGFDAAGEGETRKKLEFDLNESQKKARFEVRQTVDWSDFAQAGFGKRESLLAAQLQFSQPVEQQVDHWPEEREQLSARLKKQLKHLPAFDHDPRPRVERPVGIVEGFVDAWADVLLSCGWDDREELTYRPASWALIHFKTLPPKYDPRMKQPGDPADPRTEDAWFLLEEVVPLEYQIALGEKRKRGGKSLLSTLRGRKSSAPPGGGLSNISGSKLVSSPSISRSWRPATPPDDPFRAGAGSSTRYISLSRAGYDPPMSPPRSPKAGGGGHGLFASLRGAGKKDSGGNGHGFGGFGFGESLSRQQSPAADVGALEFATRNVSGMLNGNGGRGSGEDEKKHRVQDSGWQEIIVSPSMAAPAPPLAAPAPAAAPPPPPPQPTFAVPSAKTELPPSPSNSLEAEPVDELPQPAPERPLTQRESVASVYNEDDYGLPHPAAPAVPSPPEIKVQRASTATFQERDLPSPPPEGVDEEDEGYATPRGGGSGSPGSGSRTPSPSGPPNIPSRVASMVNAIETRNRGEREPVAVPVVPRYEHGQPLEGLLEEDEDVASILSSPRQSVVSS